MRGKVTDDRALIFRSIPISDGSSGFGAPCAVAVIVGIAPIAVIAVIGS
jgi:hypothetical protein